MIETPDEIWMQLVHKLEPSTHTVDEIEEVSVSLRNGGITARTKTPLNTESNHSNEKSIDPEEIDPEDIEIDESEIETNEEVFIYEDFGIEIKSIVENRIEDVVNSTPPLCNTEITRVTVNEDQINAVLSLKTTVSTEDTDLYHRLSQILSEQDDIESSDKFGYGVIDGVYRIDEDSIGSTGWEFDGTLNRLTDEPYKYWSSGKDTDYPTNMEEWAEFASETEAEKEQKLRRDQTPIHFHPMKRGLAEDHPYIEWFKDAEELALSKFKINEDLVESIYLTTVTLDAASIEFKVNVVV